MSLEDIEKRLKELREKWVQFPEKRKILEMQAHLLKIAKKKKEEKRTTLFD